MNIINYSSINLINDKNLLIEKQTTTHSIEEKTEKKSNEEELLNLTKHLTPFKENFIDYLENAIAKQLKLSAQEEKSSELQLKMQGKKNQSVYTTTIKTDTHSITITTDPSKNHTSITINFSKVTTQLQEFIDRLQIDYPDIQELIFITIPKDIYFSGQIDLTSLKELKHLKTLKFECKFNLNRNLINYLSLPVIPSLKSLTISNAFNVFEMGSDSTKKLIDELLSKINANSQLEELDLTGNKAILITKPYRALGEDLNQLQHLKKLILRTDPQDPYEVILSPNYYHPDALKSFSNFSSLEVLDLRGITLTNPKQLTDILSLSTLKDLSVGRMNAFKVTSELLNSVPTNAYFSGLHFEYSSLEILDFHQFAPHLRHLSFKNVEMPLDWMKIQHNTELESLTISTPCNAAQREQLNHMVLPSIKTFTAGFMRGVDLAHLIPNVIELNLSGSDILGGDLKKIGNLQFLEKLDLSKTALNGTNLTHLKKLTHLKDLNLQGLDLHQGNFSHLSSLHALESLNLSDCRLSLDQMDQLANLTFLKVLNLSQVTQNNVNITPALIAELRQRLPNTQIIE